MNTMTDEQLMDRLKKGNINAVDELYNRYAKKMYAFYYNIMQSRNPEDLVHDVFVRVIENAHRFNPKKASFRTWLFRIARNRCIDLLRHDKKIKIISIEQESGQNGDKKELDLQKNKFLDESQEVEKSFDKASVIKAVRDCINELENEDEKQAIVLYYIAGKVYREIGGIFGKSISMVKKRIMSAQMKVKRCLERKGIDSIP